MPREVSNSPGDPRGPFCDQRNWPSAQLGWVGHKVLGAGSPAREGGRKSGEEGAGTGLWEPPGKSPEVRVWKELSSCPASGPRLQVLVIYGQSG